MQIQLVIGEQDKRYLENLLAFLEKNYMDKLEIRSFSSPELLREYFSNNRADVLLLDELFGVQAEDLEGFGKAVYLCEDGAGTEQGAVRRIAKYKKPELIFKDILDLYAGIGNAGYTRAGNHRRGKFILVTGFSGGTGASTFAAALASRYAFSGNRTLYLNLETTGESSNFFSGSGSYSFEDVIFALRSQQMDVKLKMESAVRCDRSGVFYFEPCSTAMYMLELSSKDVLELLHMTEDYDYVIADMGFLLSADFVWIMGQMDSIILVEDGSEIANTKFRRTMQAVNVLEEQLKINVTKAMSVLYNQFSSSKSSSEIANLQLPVIGVIPPVKHAMLHEIIEFMLCRHEIFEKL